MGDIQRWGFRGDEYCDSFCEIDHVEDGDFVLYTDCLAEAELMENGRKLQVDDLLEQLGEAMMAIDDFCEKSKWGDKAWKEQPHIKALFDLGASDE